jgi:hypothetical protein
MAELWRGRGVRAACARPAYTDDRIRFSSAILPPYARRSKSLEVLMSGQTLSAAASS